jgi:DNA-binding NarL/FixJ family response regulator
MAIDQFKPRTPTVRLDDLYDLLVRLSMTEGLEEALNEVLVAGLHLMDADAGYIRLFDLSDTDPSQSAFSFVAQIGLSPDYLRYFSELKEPVDSERRAAIFNGRRVIIEDMTTHPSFLPHRSVVLAEGYKTLQATPLMNMNGSRCVGVLCTYFRDVSIPPSDSLEMLDLYAEFAATAIDRYQRMAALAHYGSALEDVIEKQSQVLCEIREKVKRIEDQAVFLEPDEIGRLARSVEGHIESAEKWLELAAPEEGAEPDVNLHRPYGMSPRELEAAINVWRGLSDKQIAAKMGISRFTVAKHIGAAMRKADVATRTQLSVLVEREDLQEQQSDNSAERPGIPTAGN